MPFPTSLSWTHTLWFLQWAPVAFRLWMLSSGPALLGRATQFCFEEQLLLGNAIFFENFSGIIKKIRGNLD